MQDPMSLDMTDVVRDVEKLLSAKLTKIELRYDAPQSTFGVRLDIVHPQFRAVWTENGVFQQPRLDNNSYRIPPSGHKFSSIPVLSVPI
jgi:hypothetical protein